MEWDLGLLLPVGGGEGLRLVRARDVDDCSGHGGDVAQ